MIHRNGGLILASLMALALMACAHEAVTKAQAVKIAEFKQKATAGVGRTSRSNGYFVSLRGDGKGRAWMKGEEVSRPVTWTVGASAELEAKGADDPLVLCLAFGPAINFPEGRTFCTPTSSWDPVGAWASVPPLEG